MKWDNPYSKFRYDNSLDVKFRVNADKTTRVYGTELRSFSGHIKNQLPSVPSTWVNNGATWVSDYIFNGSQINKVDQPVVDDETASRWRFFRLFKL
jgi:hypothetical protein